MVSLFSLCRIHLCCAVLLWFAGCGKDPSVTQEPGPTDPPAGTELTVVYHVLYEDASDPGLNLPVPKIDRAQAWINKFYAATLYDSGVSVPVEVSFVPASTDPQGRVMAEPGIHRVRYTGATSVDPDAFLKGNPELSVNTEIFWDPNKYINIWLCKFDADNENVTGISYLPYCLNSNKLDGLPEGGEYFYENMPSYMHGIILNSQYWSDADLDVEGLPTLCHEMGHYLGLLHAFDETGSGRTNPDDYNDDKCSDTPQYDRAAYEQWLNDIWDQLTPVTVGQIYWRKSYKGVSFQSANVMDYYFGSRTSLTNDQRGRIRYVLKYSPLIPRAAGSSQSGVARSNYVRVTEEPAPVIIRCPRR